MSGWKSVMPRWLGKQGFESQTEKWLAENAKAKDIDQRQNQDRVHNEENLATAGQREELFTDADTTIDYEGMVPMSYESEEEEQDAAYQAQRENRYLTSDKIWENTRYDYQFEDYPPPAAELFLSVRRKVQGYARKKREISSQYPLNTFYEYYVENYADDDEKLDKVGLKEAAREMRQKELQKELERCELNFTKEAFVDALQLFYDDRTDNLHDGVVLAALQKLKSFARGKTRRMTDEDEPVIDTQVYGDNGFADLVAWEANSMCWGYHLIDTDIEEEVLEEIRARIDEIRGVSLDAGPQGQSGDDDGGVEMEIDSSTAEPPSLVEEDTDKKLIVMTPINHTPTPQDEEEDEMDTGFIVKEHLTGHTFTEYSAHTASFASIKMAFSHDESSKKPSSNESAAADDGNASVASGLESLMEESDEELERDYSAEHNLKRSDGPRLA